MTNLCSNCKSTIVDNTPYRASTIITEPMEDKRSFGEILMARAVERSKAISKRQKKIALIVAGVIAGIGIPAACFRGVFLTMATGLVGIAILASILWIAVYVPYRLGFWIAKKLHWAAFYDSDGSRDLEAAPIGWMVGVAVIAIPPTLVWLVYAMGQYISQQLHWSL